MKEKQEQRQREAENRMWSEMMRFKLMLVNEQLKEKQDFSKKNLETDSHKKTPIFTLP